MSTNLSRIHAQNFEQKLVKQCKSAISERSLIHSSFIKLPEAAKRLTRKVLDIYSVICFYVVLLSFLELLQTNVC